MYLHLPSSPVIPERKHVPFSCPYPENWTPVDPQFDYELVPLNPDGMEYHLVASEVCKSLPGRTIQDIYRIQNPYLWHKFDRLVRNLITVSAPGCQPKGMVRLQVLFCHLVAVWVRDTMVLCVFWQQEFFFYAMFTFHVRCPCDLHFNCVLWVPHGSLTALLGFLEVYSATVASNVESNVSQFNPLSSAPRNNIITHVSGARKMTAQSYYTITTQMLHSPREASHWHLYSGCTTLFSSCNHPQLPRSLQGHHAVILRAP